MFNQDFMHGDAFPNRDGAIDFESEAIFQDLQAFQPYAFNLSLIETSLTMEGRQQNKSLSSTLDAVEENASHSINLDGKSDLGHLPDFNLEDIPDVNNDISFEQCSNGRMTLLPFEKVISDDPTSADSKVEFSERIRLNYHQKPIVETIKNVYQSKDCGLNLTFEEIYKKSRDTFLKEIVKESSFRKKGSKSLSAITDKRCNETKYTRSLLRCFVAAASELLSYSDHSALQLYRDLETCTRVEQIHAFMVKPTREWFVAFLKEFLIPGQLMVRVIERLNNKPAISILLLEAMLVLQRMVLEPWRKFNTWKIEKLQIKGSYGEALDKLKEGTASLDYIKRFAQQEYKNCLSKFKNRKCSDKNNITHFWVSLTNQMLSEITSNLNIEAKSSDPSEHKYYQEVNYLLRRSIDLLSANESQESLLASIEDIRIGQIIVKRFIKTNRLLEMILTIDSTNAMMIHNLISRYEWFVGLFRK